MGNDTVDEMFNELGYKILYVDKKKLQLEGRK